MNKIKHIKINIIFHVIWYLFVRMPFKMCNQWINVSYSCVCVCCCVFLSFSLYSNIHLSCIVCWMVMEMLVMCSTLMLSWFKAIYSGHMECWRWRCLKWICWKCTRTISNFINCKSVYKHWQMIYLSFNIHPDVSLFT